MSRSTEENLIIFDLDGVITGEDAYWDTAGLVVHELLYSPRYWHVDRTLETYSPASTAEECRRVSRQILPEPFILSLKARSVNSNWDTCYGGFCLYLIELLAQLPDRAALLPLRPADADWIALFRAQLARLEQPVRLGGYREQFFDQPLFQDATGMDVIERYNDFASELLGYPIAGVFARYSPSWYFCQDRFQEWYLGDALYTKAYGHAPVQPGKVGCILFEQPLLPLEKIAPTLSTLREAGYTLGVATGRPGEEAITPLQNYGLLQYFSDAHVVTQAQVEEAEVLLHERGDTTYLGKPHPYQFLRAADPTYQPGQPVAPRGSFIVVGDTPSDVRGGHAAGAIVIAVLSGARTAQARALLQQSQPDFLVDDMTQVPAVLQRIDDLATIQRLQFSDKPMAELLLQRWFYLHMDLQVDSVTLTPRPVSLNSFNGVYQTGDEEYFFKTHVEEQGILEEYYHAEMLHNAGYNIVRPVRTLHEKGQQMVIYPVVHEPVMFDLMRAVETGQSTQVITEQLVAAEQRECERLLDIYARTLSYSSEKEHASAPIHQLFWHRLAGERYRSFYEGKQVPLPQDAHGQVTSIPFADVLRYRWVINGREPQVRGEQRTLGELVERAKIVLNPARMGMTVIGHGDAHFGNVFLEEQKYYRYFDPAFAGRHSPLLDVVKPLFHNVFATWMYFPRDIARDLHLSVTIRNKRVEIEHDYQLTPVRQALLTVKKEQLLEPLKAMLRSKQALPDDWDELLRSALLCCPLLTINLLDEARMPATISWLGLTFVMEMAHFDVTS